MDTNSFEYGTPVTTIPISNLFREMAKSKPTRTRSWVKLQVQMINEETSVSELAQLLQHANLLLRPNMSRKQFFKTRELIVQINIHLITKTWKLSDIPN